MSRIGKLPIALPSGVTVDVKDSEVEVKGPKGSLTQSLVNSVSVAVEGNQLLVHRTDDQRQSRANHGLMRSLLNNMVTGVSQGFKRELEVIGVGYRAAVKGKTLEMNLGYSHPVNFAIPDGIKIEVDKQGIISVEGIDKQQVGQVAAEIRAWRKPDSYKGKGVRYKGEHVSLKAGKSAK
ncbi:MAG: 50S ribosomal protein L6 [Myxococcota bacterium]